jgi:predicted deacylase
MRSLRIVPMAMMASGAEAALHLHEIRGGRGSGPTIGICGAIHGDECVGTQMIMELARTLDPAALAGRLLLLPVANPFSFEAGGRQNPVDDLNMNRVFPGAVGGWFSEQLAALIVREFLDKIDVLIDIHAGGRMPTVDYVYIFNHEELSRAFGSKLLYRPQGGVSLGTIYGGTLSSVSLDRGIPTVTLEIGGGLIDQAPFVARGVSGLHNMLRVLGALPGAASARADQVTLSQIRIVRPSQGGFLHTEAPPLGEPIGEGDVLGRVVSPYSFEELEVIRNPVRDGWMVLAHLSRNLVQPGDYGYMVGQV